MQRNILRVSEFRVQIEVLPCCYPSHVQHVLARKWAPQKGYRVEVCAKESPTQDSCRCKDELQKLLLYDWVSRELCLSCMLEGTAFVNSSCVVSYKAIAPNTFNFSIIWQLVSKKVPGYHLTWLNYHPESQDLGKWFYFFVLYCFLMLSKV